jgi:hypothetical protein
MGLLFLLLAACSFQPIPQTSPNETELEPQAIFYQQLGGALDVTMTDPARSPVVALDSAGNPTAAWIEQVGGIKNLYVKRWTGSSWQQLGGLDTPKERFLEFSVIAVDQQGYPVVAYAENEGFGSYLKIKRWNGSSWQQLGEEIYLSKYGTTLSIAINSQNHPIVAVGNADHGYASIFEWDGASLIEVATSGEYAFCNGCYVGVSLALDANDVPILAITAQIDGSRGPRRTYVKYASNGMLVDLGLNPLNVGTGNSGGVSLTGGILPTVAWTEARTNDPNIHNLFIKQWNGSSWVALGATGSNGFGNFDIRDVRNPSLATNARGDLAIVYQTINEVTGNSDIYHVRRWNGSSWDWIGEAGNRLDVNDPAGNAVTPSLALSANGNPTIAFAEDDNIYVKRFTTNGFTPYGGSLHFAIEDNSINPSITLTPTGNPMVAWQEYAGTTWYHDIFVRRWDGTGWPSVGNSDVKISSSNDSINPSVVSDSAGNPVVAWAEGPGGLNSYNIYVQRWNGTAWVSYGSGTPIDRTASNNATKPSIALDSNNRPYVAWIEEVNGSRNIYVKRWNGSNWVWVGGSAALDVGINNYVGKPSLAIGSDSVPVIAWAEENASGNSNIYVKRLVGNTWTLVGTGPIDRVIANYAESPSLDLDNSNNPVVAWSESVSTSWNVYSKRWDAATSSWVLVGNIIDKTATNNAYTPSLQVGTNNNPVISWWETDNGSENIYVKRWNSTTSKWVQVSTGAVDTNLSQDATMPSMVLNAANNPIVAWQESTATEQHNIYVKGY